MDGSEQKSRFGIFFTRFRTSTGRVSSGAGFDHKTFSETYGEQAAQAYEDFEHFTDNPPETAVTKGMFESAILFLTNLFGFHPDVISSGKEDANIEDL